MKLQLRSKLNASAVEALVGKKPEPGDFPIVASGRPVAVYKPDGTPLLFLIPGAISESAKLSAYPFMHRLRAYKSLNRVNYSGEERTMPVRKSGVVSHTNEAAPVRSAVVGYFDRTPRFPFCRETAYTTHYPGEWAQCLDMLTEAAAAFEEKSPIRYRAQLEAAKATHPAYVIPGTPFTTVTVNNCVAGAYHRDSGDYAPGFGAMAVFRKGDYRGCHLGFPAYGVSVDLGDRDLILFDPHEVHGNTPFHDAVGEEGTDWERISMVLYYRAKMLDCLSPSEELARTKATRGALPTPEPTDE